jgi:F0F1-type ATP synthase membrane subunit b/b'
MRRTILAAALALVLLAPGMRAEEAKGEGEGGLEIWAWANFAILAGGLTWVFRKNAAPYFAKRAIGIRKSMVEADEARADAERRIGAVEAKLASLPADIKALKDEAIAEARSEHQRVSHETAAAIAKIHANAEQEIASAGKAARAELKRYFATLAVGVAAEKVRERMTPVTQDALVRGFVRNLTGAAQ